MSAPDQPDDDPPREDEPDERRLLRLAGEILDGSRVDWAEAGTAGSPFSEELRAIEALAQVAPQPFTGAWGPLRVIERIGAGAFGEVYRAWDTRLDREVALKLIDPFGAAIDPASTVIEEGRLLARVKHPNVVTVFGAEALDGRIGIWTEFVHGETLAADVARRGPLPPGEAIAIGLEICSALDAIHRAGVVHGDVKAHNVLREAGGRIVLIDLGTGHEHLRNIAATSGRQISGTPLYMAPELWRLEPPTPQSDVYSLGVLLYFLATGTYPVRGATSDDLRQAHAQGRRVPLGDERSDLPAAFVAAVERALSTDRSLRFDGAGAFQTALALADPAAARLRRRRAAAMLAAIAAVGLLIWIVIALRPDLPDATATPLTSQLTFRPPERGVNAAAISPDGRSLALADANGLEIQTVATQESRPVSLPPEIRAIADVSWLADSRTLLIATNDGVWQTRPDEGAAAQIADVGGLIAVSPDGRYVAVRQSGQGRIFVMTTEGADRREIVPSTPKVSISRPTWSPDSRRIAYAKHGGASGASAPRIVSCAREGGAETTVLKVTSLLALIWAADGRILFSMSQATSSQLHDLFAVDVDPTTGAARGSPRPIVPGRNLSYRNLTQTRDGRLAFTSIAPQSQTYVASFDRDRLSVQQPERMSDTSTQERPAGWMPSGDRFLNRAGGSKYWRVYDQPIDRREPRLLLPADLGEVWDAAPSADGRWVLYAQLDSIMRWAVTGGRPPETLFGQNTRNARLRCTGPGAGVCVASMRQDNARVTQIVSFDPTADPATSQPRQHPLLPAADWDLSPDGTEVVGVDSSNPAGGLVLLDISNDRPTRVPVSALAGAVFISWAGTREGWIATKMVGAEGSQVLYVDRAGRAKVIWERPDLRLMEVIVSPDGRHIAFARSLIDRNVWMLERY